MKTAAIVSNKTQGSVLPVALVIAGVLGIALASFLILVSNQSRNVARSKHWNQSLIVAEAGIEDALQMVNKFAGTTTLTDWRTTCASDNWSVAGNVYSLTRYMDANRTTYYEVYITNLNTAFNNLLSIRATGYTRVPSGVLDETTLSRTILIRAKTDTLFNVAMAALGTIDLKGNGISTDSFDSMDPLYSTNGFYTPLKRKAGGDIATNNSITNSVLAVGNANIRGTLFTGPLGSYSILNGSVGDIPWVDAGTPGVMPGYWRNDLNIIFDDVVEPTTPFLPTGGAGGGGSGTAPDGNYYDHVFTLSGDYTVTDNRSIYVGTNVHVRIKTVNLGSVYIAGTGGTGGNSGTMVAYLTGSSASLTSTKLQSGKPVNLQIYGLPSVTDISYSGNGDFTGVVYAPQAVFSLNGGGSSTTDFIGASVTKVVKMNGHYNFHYDEDLKRAGPSKGYIATGWQEL